MQPQSSGLGGGCAIVLYNGTTGEVTVIDGREEAPDAFTEDAFCVPNTNCSQSFPFYPDLVTGGHPVGVPGTLAAAERVLREFGTISLSEALQPGIDAATNGFVMYEDLFGLITSNIDRLSRFPASAALFLSPDASTPRVAVGQYFTNPDLAETFRAIAANGSSEPFYLGSIGEDIVSTVHSAVGPWTNLTGLMTMEDLATYRPVKRYPIRSGYREYEVVGADLPGSGGLVVSEILSLLQAKRFNESVPLSFSSISTFINAQNLAFADRNAYLGDPDFNDIPVEGLLNSSFLEGRWDGYTNTSSRAIPVPVPFGTIEGFTGCGPDLSNALKKSTTHFTVTDAWGNVVSWTSTIEENLGSAVVVPGRGFLLNNELTDFDATPYNPQQGCWALGGKRPLSSMSPTLVLHNGSPILSFGSPGGSRIIGLVVNVAVNYLDFGMSLRDAVDAPRVISRNGIADVEHSLYIQPELHAALIAAGFNITDNWGSRPYGYVQSLAMSPNASSPTGRTIVAVADNKRQATAAAFAY